jgi:uncharacterized membrane protein
MAAISKVTASQLAELSGLVFGLALAISALQLALNPPTQNWDLLSWILEFVVSFAILIWVWFSLLQVTRNVSVEYDWMVFLNVALLLFVVLEPYPLFLTWAATFDNSKYAGVQDLSATVWAVDVGLMFIVLGLMTYFVRNDPRHAPTHRATVAFARLASWRIGCGLAMALTALPIFFTWSWATGWSAPGATPDLAYPIVVHARMLLWIPILIVAAAGSAYYLAASGRLETPTRSTSSAQPTETDQDGEGG